MALYAGETVRFTTRVSEDRSKRAALPIPAAVTVTVKSGDEATTHLEPVAMTLEKLQVRFATGGSETTLVDSTRSWLKDQWRDKVVRIISGQGAGQERRIKSNTATMLTIDADEVVNGVPVGQFTSPPDATSEYEIVDCVYEVTWDSPAALANTSLVAIVRATQAAPHAYTAAEKLHFRLEGAV